MTGSIRVMSRRTFLRDLGHGAFALSLVGVVGCGPRAAGSFDPLNYDGNLEDIESYWCQDDLPSTPPSADATGRSTWAPIGDSRASGYVLVRGGEATIVDTGPWCVPEVIAGGLSEVGLGWSAVGSVVITHKHPDHWVGLPTVLDRAVDAVVYVGAEDIPYIASSRAVVAVGAGDRVMDLAIIPTPGHTSGHIVVHDETAGVLVVGDAVIYGADYGFDLLGTSEDLPQARASLSVLAGLSFETLLPGHGDAIVGGAWQRLTDYLAAH